MRALCIWNSQPPPNAMPRTAATTGTSEYLSRMLVAWKFATIASNSAILPALSSAERAFEIGAGRERLAGLPEHQRLEARVRDSSTALLHAIEHGIVDRVHLGLERDDADVVAEMPQAHAVVFEHRRSLIELLADQRIGE